MTRLDDRGQAGSTDYPPSTPPEYIAPLGASINTWPNIVKNKDTIDFCVEQFHHLMTRSFILSSYIVLSTVASHFSDLVQDPLSWKAFDWPAPGINRKFLVSQQEIKDCKVSRKGRSHSVEIWWSRTNWVAMKWFEVWVWRGVIFWGPVLNWAFILSNTKSWHLNRVPPFN